MSKKFSERFEHNYEYKLAKPELSDKDEYIEEIITSVTDRFFYFPSTLDLNDRQEYCEDSEQEINTLQYYQRDDRRVLSFKKILDIVQKENLDLDNIFITGSINDDNFSIEAIHVKKLNDEEKNDRFNEKMKKWQKLEDKKLEQEKQRLQWEMESLQKRLDSLKNK